MEETSGYGLGMQARYSHSSSCLPRRARFFFPVASSSDDDHEAAGYGEAAVEKEAAADHDQHQPIRRAQSCSKLPGSKLKLLPSFRSLLRRAHSLSYPPHRQSSSQSCAKPPSQSSLKRVPRGHVAVYVEPGKERHVVPIVYINHPQFQALLERAECEFGLRPTGPGLRIPCSRSELHRTLHQIRTQ